MMGSSIEKSSMPSQFHTIPVPNCCTSFILYQSYTVPFPYIHTHTHTLYQFHTIPVPYCTVPNCASSILYQFHTVPVPYCISAMLYHFNTVPLRTYSHTVPVQYIMYQFHTVLVPCSSTTMATQTHCLTKMHLFLSTLRHDTIVY